MAAFIFSSTYCISAAIIYQSNRSKNGAIKAIIFGSIIMILVSSIANYTFILDAYSKLYGMPLEAIIGLGNKIFPIVKDKLSFVLCCVVPFNLAKTVFVDALTMLLYKHISPLLKG